MVMSPAMLPENVLRGSVLRYNMAKSDTGKGKSADNFLFVESHKKVLCRRHGKCSQKNW